MFGVENCQILSNLRKYIEICCISVIQIFVSDTSHYENVPYTLPNGWCWCKLGDLCSFESGFAFSSNDFKTSGIPLVRISNIQDNTVTLKNCVFIQDQVDEKYIIKTGDLLIAMSGATTGKMGIYSMRQRALLNQRVGNICVQSRYLTANYRNYFMYSQSDVILKMAYGGAQPNISSQMILNIPIPLPPLSEQYRIVNAIKNLLEIVDRIEENQISLDKFLCSIKQKILQLALSGNLLTQDHNDEPAIDLLRRINPSYIPCDNRHYENVPYKVPETWQWVKLKDLCVFLSRGKSPVYSETDKRYPVFAQKCNLKEGGISLKEARFLEPRTISKWKDVYKLQDGDILVNSTGTGTVCRTRLFRSEYLCDYPFVVPDSHVSVIRTDRLISSEYAYLVLVSKFSQTYMMDNLAGSTNQKELYISVLENLLFPLPPADEQKRIVKCVNEIYMQLEQISSEL